MYRTTVVAVLVAVFTGTARGGQDAGPAQTAPAPASSRERACAVLRAAGEAVRAGRYIRYEASNGPLGDAEDRSRIVRGAVLLEVRPPAECLRVSVDAEVRTARSSQAGRLQVAGDGRYLCYLNHARRVFMRTELEDESLVLREVESLLLRPACEEQPFASLLRAETLDHEGTLSLDGLTCEVVHAVSRAEGLDERWYFEAADHLPRRVDRRTSAAGGDGRVSMIIHRIELLAEAPPGTFTLSHPDGYRDASPPTPHLPFDSPAPEWTLATAAGTPLSLRDLRGKTVVIAFWATWCDQCRRSFAGLQALHEAYRERGLVVIAISCMERERGLDLQAVASKYGLPFALVHGDTDIVGTYHIRAVPTTYLIDRTGRVVYGYTGSSEARRVMLVKLIEESLRAE